MGFMVSSILKRAFSIGMFMLVAAILSAIVGLIMAVPVMLLWNWVMPHITNNYLHRIDLLRAWGLITLIGILFSSGRSNGHE